MRGESHHLFGGTLLVSGMSIGVGMLALPVVTAAGGFLPAVLIYLICWFFMVCFARLVLEALLWMPHGSNFITISRNLLGKKGAVFCWFLYLFLFYCLMTAHTAAGGEAIFLLSRKTFAPWLSTLIYVLLFAPVIYLGTASVSRLNMAMMAGVFITYCLFVGTTLPSIDLALLSRASWTQIWSAVPVVLTAFGFQNLVPTLYTYMHQDHRAIRKAIWIGTLIPLVLYILWEFLVLGIAPTSSLLEAFRQGQSSITSLQTTLHNELLEKIAIGFGFFAMSASFVAISIAFFDFWADGLHWRKKGRHRIGLILLVFGFPLLFVFLDPTLFITALQLAGGFGAMTLFGVLPILFVWMGRYKHHYTLEYQFIPGGKFTLSLLFLFAISVLASLLETLT